MTARFEERDESPTDTPDDTPPVTAVVDDALDRLDGEDPVAAARLAEAVLAERPAELEKSGVEAVSLPGEARTGVETRPATDWLAAVRELFDPERVPRLDGLDVVLGLGLLDGALRRHLDDEGILDTVEATYEPPLPDLLTEAGRSRRMPADSGVGAPRWRGETPNSFSTR